MAEKFKKIILTGGGTGGSIVPLVGIHHELNKSHKADIRFDFLWFGMKDSLEKEIAEVELLLQTTTLDGWMT